MGRRLLSGLCNSWNFSTNDFLSFIQVGGWRLEDNGLDKHSLEVEGISEAEATYLSPVLFVGLFWIDSI
jgi:hypothetical protein